MNVTRLLDASRRVLYPFAARFIADHSIRKRIAWCGIARIVVRGAALHDVDFTGRLCV
jgi:hypothetical protein